MARIHDSGEFQLICSQCKETVVITGANVKCNDAKCRKCGIRIDTSEFKRCIDNLERGR